MIETMNNGFSKQFKKATLENYRIESRKIKVSEYQTLRQTTGWDPIENEQVKKALSQDLFAVCVLDNDKPIGMGRVIGDSAIYFYIQDVIVDPGYQAKGIGKLIMDSIEDYLAKETNNNSFIGLMAAEGVMLFYEQFGYKKRPDDRPGMFKVIKK